MQKRIELVRALMAEPRLLLLDEPAAGLNPAETEILRAQLDAICRSRGVSLLVVEHDLQFVGALCAEVVVLDFGRKIAEGTPAAISARPGSRKSQLGTTAAYLRASMPNLPRRSAMRLEVAGLEVRYGRIAAVRGVSLRVDDGEIVAVLGANGAGKSSLLHAVMGLVLAAAGKVMLDGADISGWAPSRRMCGQDSRWCRRAGAS